MNTILLQKILDILTEGLAHVGDFFKDLFVSDPQDGQVIGYDGDTGKWKNMDIAELSFDITHTAGPADSITITDAAADMPVKSLIVDIKPQQASGTPTPDNPLPISGTDEVVITHTYGDNETETKTITLHSTVYGGEVDVVSGQGTETYNLIDLGTLSWSEANNSMWVAALSGMEAVAPNRVPPFICEEYNAVSWQAGTGSTVIDNCFCVLPQYNQVRVRNLACTTQAEFEEAINGVHLCYSLATPTHITTTPTTIKTPGGTETFTIDANEMELEYYTATAGTIKDLVCITEDITSEITKNTTNFSDILLKVSQNNKVVSVEIYSATTAAAVNDTFLSNLPKPAMNCPVTVINKTVGEEGIFYGSLSTSGALSITVPGAKSFGGLITYVAK